MPNKLSGFLTIFLSLLVIALIIFLIGSSNPFTPAGYVGYLTRGAILGKASYVGLQIGPTSPGRGWLLQVINVSITPYTYAEDFSGENSVLSADNLKIYVQYWEAARSLRVFPVTHVRDPSRYGPIQISVFFVFPLVP